MRGNLSYPNSYYAATAHPYPPYPSLDGEGEADVCVVGGGFAGVSAALCLTERGYRVALLEAGRMGFGASGRNGGQIGSGLRARMGEIERLAGRDNARMLWQMCEEAKAIIAQNIERFDIRCGFRPGNLLAATRERFLPGLAAEAEHLSEHYGYGGYQMLSARQIRALLATDAYCGGRMDTGGGHMHPLNYLLGVADAARSRGAEIFEQSEVLDVRWSDPCVVRTARGQIHAPYVLLCGNAYLGNLAPRIGDKIMPIVNHVLATEPLGEERARELISNDCCVHSTKFVVDYFRLSADGRLIFGGGETYSNREIADIKGFVRRYMLAVFPQLEDVGIDYAWSGRLAITMNRLPHFGRIGRRGFLVQGFSGHGVALAQLAGRLMAEAVAGDAERFDVFARLKHRSFPGGTLLRKPLLVLGMLYYALRDRF
jgi:gamma-glutamylputrescine oxidase